MLTFLSALGSLLSFRVRSRATLDLSFLHSAGIALSPVPCSYSLQVPLLHSPRSATCTIATNFAQPAFWSSDRTSTAVEVPGVITIRNCVTRRQARREPMRAGRVAKEQLALRSQHIISRGIDRQTDLLAG